MEIVANITRNADEPLAKPFEQILGRQSARHINPIHLHVCKRNQLLLFLFAHTKPRKLFLYDTTKHVPKSVHALSYLHLT